MTTETQAPDPAPRMGVEEQRELLKRLRHYGDNDRDTAAALIEQLSASLYKAEGRNGKLASDLASAQDCISGWVTFGSNVTDALGLRVMSPKDILAEIARLRAIPAPEGADERAAWAEVEDCLGMYWNAAYAEAKEARDHDDIGGTAQRALTELRQAIKAYALAARAALAAPAKAPCTHGAEHCTNTSCERLGECQYMAAPAPQAAPAWQPIETAPKDRTEILGWTPACGALVLYWEKLSDDGRWSDGMSYFHREPTHWMPLPAAPQTKEPTHDR